MFGEKLLSLSESFLFTGPPSMDPEPWLRVAETFDAILPTIAEVQASPGRLVVMPFQGTRRQTP